MSKPQLTNFHPLKLTLCNQLMISRHAIAFFGQLPTLEELLDPTEEREMGECPAFEGCDKAIANEVHREIAVASGEIIEIDSDFDDDNSVAASHHMDRSTASNLKLDECNMVIYSFHNFVNFVLYYNEKKNLMLDSPLQNDSSQY
ncbi:hypothetical protein BDR04DRAFT_1092450, partial [Suillus decipiens]